MLSPAVAGVAPPIEAHRLDRLMRNVTEACLLPDLETHDPAEYLAAHGWVGDGNLWAATMADDDIVIAVNWPATDENAAACSVYSHSIEPAEYYDWLQDRIGEANDHPWDASMPLAIWRINTNGHDAGIYVSRDEHPATGTSSSVLHILQSGMVE